MRILMHILIVLIVGFEAYALFSGNTTLIGMGVLLIPVALVATVVGKRGVHYSFDDKKPEKMSKTDLFLQTNILSERAERKGMLLLIPLVIALFLIATGNDVLIYTGFALVVLSSVTIFVIRYIYDYQSIKYEVELYKDALIFRNPWAMIRKNQPRYKSAAEVFKKIFTTSLFFDVFINIVVLIAFAFFIKNFFK